MLQSLKQTQSIFFRLGRRVKWLEDEKTQSTIFRRLSNIAFDVPHTQKFAMMLWKLLLVLLPCLVGGWVVPGPGGKPIGEWSLPPRIGRFSCMDSAYDGLVVGTMQGYVVKFSVETNLKPNVTRLAPRELLHVSCKGDFVGGAFYDACRNMYVVRAVDFQDRIPPLQVYHETHVLGSGFMRVHFDLCYFSLSIDGWYVVTSLRRKCVLKRGKIQDLVGGKPSCVSVMEDGVVAVGTHHGLVVLVDMGCANVVSWTYHSPFLPAAIHAVRKYDFGAKAKAAYEVAWTGAEGRLCTGSIVGRRNPVCLQVKDHGRVADESLVGIRISQQHTISLQSVTGKTTLRRLVSSSVDHAWWMVPMPWLDNFVWACNEKHAVSLLYFDDEDEDDVASAVHETTMPCDSAH